MKKNSLFIILISVMLSCNSETEKKAKNENKTESTNTVESKTDETTVTEKEVLNLQLLLAGDIVFQTSNGEQSKLIALATQSPFTHCGLIVKKENQWMVLEAFNGVSLTPLQTWIDRGLEGKFTVMRLKNRDKQFNQMNPKMAQKILGAELNKPYDSYYKWSDEAMYCSELVWKMYQNTLKLEICTLRKLSDYDLSTEEVKTELKNKYGATIPLNETMVAPSDIASSDMLEMFYSNY
jgi:uncharacterized protein YycO